MSESERTEEASWFRIEKVRGEAKYYLKNQLGRLATRALVAIRSPDIPAGIPETITVGVPETPWSIVQAEKVHARHGKSWFVGVSATRSNFCYIRYKSRSKRKKVKCRLLQLKKPNSNSGEEVVGTWTAQEGGIVGGERYDVVRESTSQIGTAYTVTSVSEFASYWVTIGMTVSIVPDDPSGKMEIFVSGSNWDKQHGEYLDGRHRICVGYLQDGILFVATLTRNGGFHTLECHIYQPGRPRESWTATRNAA